MKQHIDRLVSRLDRRVRVVLAALGLAVLLVVPATPALAATDLFSGACSTDAAKASSACQNNGGAADPIGGENGIINKGSYLLAFIGGIAAIIIIVIGGVMYITSGGDPSKVGTAKTTIIYACIGLVVIVSARAIVIFVLNNYK